MTAIATADAAASLRRLNQLRARSKRAVSWRILLSTFRAKNGERVGSGTLPRTSHNCLSSSRSILKGLNYLPRGKLRSNGYQQALFTIQALRGRLPVAE